MRREVKSPEAKSQAVFSRGKSVPVLPFECANRVCFKLQFKRRSHIQEDPLPDELLNRFPRGQAWVVAELNPPSMISAAASSVNSSTVTRMGNR